MSEPIRVLVVDDSTFMRSALVRMIEQNPIFKVVDTACNGKEGVEKAQLLKPDVMTMDVEMPVMTGLEALREVMKTVKTPVIMVSTLTEAGAKTTMEALEIGAVDFIPKALGDKSGNIFRGAEVLHEKLLAVAKIDNVRRASLQSKVNPKQAAVAAMAGPVVKAHVPERKGPLPARVNARIMVIGSSTGGPRALGQVIGSFPKNLPIPVVVAQHMPAHFTMALAKRLDETCSVKVVEAAHGMKLEAGTVYIGPGGLHMRMNGASIEIHEERGESPYKPSVDVLAESARKIFGKQVLAMMLTGMGNDGTREFVKLRESGAYVLSQDAATSVVYGMPKAVAEAGGVDEVLSLTDIGPRAARLVGV
ncbi:MAG: chemotaxis response regulator protein-glutamate methylesterase [Alphaproteobacteria bacterium]